MLNCEGLSWRISHTSIGTIYIAVVWDLILFALDDLAGCEAYEIFMAIQNLNWYP